MKVGTRHCSPAYASKVAGTAFGTARLVELALSADDALLFRSVRPFHHRSDAEAMGGGVQSRRSDCGAARFAGGWNISIYALASKLSARRQRGSTCARPR